MLRIDHHVTRLILLLLQLFRVPQIVHAEPGGNFGSPIVTQTQGNVTINYGNIEIVRKQPATNGPSLRQIQVAVQSIVESNVTRSKKELTSLIEQELDRLENITVRLAQMYSELQTHDTAHEARYQLLFQKLDAIQALLDQGRTGEARSSFDDIRDLADPASAFAVRTSAQTSIGGYLARVYTAALLWTYELAVWPEGIGSSSFALGWGLALGKGSARGGYASPEPEHRIVAPIEFSSVRGSILGIANLLLRRDQRVGISMSLELHLGTEGFSSEGSVSSFSASVYELHLRGGISTRFLHTAFVSVEIDLGLAPWAQHPAFPYTGFGASYSDPRISGGVDVGLAISIGYR